MTITTINAHDVCIGSPRFFVSAIFIVEAFSHLARQDSVFFDFLLGVPKPLVDLLLTQVQLATEFCNDFSWRGTTLVCLI